MGLLDLPPYPAQLYKEMPREPLNIVTRSEWGAKPPTSEEQFTEFPIRDVIMGYTETEPCTNKDDCIKLMRMLQEKHMAEGMSDIRYSYVIGADFNVYEGRGWTKKPGIHNRYSSLKGNNMDLVHTAIRGKLPDGMLSSVMWNLLDQGEYAGYVDENLKVYQDFEDPAPNADNWQDTTEPEWTCGGTEPLNISIP